MKSNVLVTNNELIIKANGLTMLNHAQVSTESFESFIKGISTFFSGKLKIISDIFGTNNARSAYVKKENDLSLIVKDLVSKKFKMQAFIREKNYSDIMNTLTPTVIGLNTNFPTAAKSIQSVFTTIHKECIPALEQLDIFTAKVLTDRDTRMATKPMKADSVLESETKNLQSVLEKLVSTKNVGDSVPFKEVFPNLNSMEETFNILVNLSYSPSLKDIEAIDNVITGIVERINILAEELKSKDYEISKTVISKLSADLENGAKCVTVIMSHMHLYHQLVTIYGLILDTAMNR